MAHYAYKNFIDLLPDDFRERFAKFYGHEFDDDWNYNGDGWLIAVDYALRVNYLFDDSKMADGQEGIE